MLQKKMRINNECRMILTSHLFRKREGEVKTRFFSVFRNTFQISDLINYAIEEVDLLSYKGAGKIAIIVPVEERDSSISKYGISLTVDKSIDTCNYKYDISIITIDKQDDRHFTDCMQLNKSSFRFYFEDYIVCRSYNANNLFNLITFKSHKKKVRVQLNRYFSLKRFWFIDLFGVAVDSFFIGLFSFVTKENIINKGAFWYLICINNQKQMYLRFTIETNWEQNGYLLILLDVRQKNKNVLSYIEKKQKIVKEYHFNLRSKDD